MNAFVSNEGKTRIPLKKERKGIIGWILRQLRRFLPLT